ncbi:MAG: protoporphyrinogen oxidase [Vicinamibacterales bacterium]
MTEPADLDVAIIGGGIAGLSAAYQLKTLGLTARVLEAGTRAGGVIVTERTGGWVIDGGPDSILVQKPAAVSLCRELGIADALVPTLTPRTAYVLRDGTLHPIVEGSFLGFPLSAKAFLRSSLFSLHGKVRMAAEAVLPRGGGEEDESIGSFVRRRFGDEAAEYLADPLLAGIHAGDADRLSVQALFPRLVEAERRTGSVIRAFRALQARPSPNGAFVSLPGGTGALVEALVKALGPDAIRYQSPVTELHREGLYVVESAGTRHRARAVILAVPAYIAGSLLGSFDTRLAGLCAAVPYASTATVALGYRTAQVRRPMIGSGFVVPRLERTPLLAATWVTSKWPGRAPDGHVLLRGFLGGGRDPHRTEASDEVLIATVRQALGELMDIEGEPVVARLFRFTRQSPQYEVGHLHRVTSIEQMLSAHPGLFVTGSGFRSIGIPDTIADARETATRAAEFLRRRPA